MNILALNAATEASLAEDYGRGFSIIADELKVFAQAMESASFQIREVAASFQLQLEKVLGNVHLFEKLFAFNKYETDFIGKGCHGITDHLGHIDELVTEIERKSNDVLSTAESTEDKMTELTEATQKVADFIEEIINACMEQIEALSEASETVHAWQRYLTNYNVLKISTGYREK